MTEQFPHRLKRLRERRGINRVALAELCGIEGNDTIGRYERGERKPSIESAARLAEFFGVTMDYLCGTDIK